MTSYARELGLALRRAHRFPGDSSVMKFANGLPATGPVAVVASGCSLPVAELVAVELSASHSIAARAVTPLEFLTSQSRAENVIVVSASGAHPHTIGVIDAIPRGAHAAVVTLDADAPVVRIARARGIALEVLLPSASPAKGGYVPIEAPLALWAAASPETYSESVLHLEQLWSHARSTIVQYQDSLRGAETLTVLHTGWGRPACIDLCTRLIETGASAALSSDAWNYAHGRANVGASKTASAIILFSGNDPRSQKLAGEMSASRTPDLVIVPLLHDVSGVACCAQSYLTSIAAAGTIAELMGIDAAAPSEHPFGRALYMSAPRATDARDIL